jgi:hypothetical protein
MKMRLEDSRFVMPMPVLILTAMPDEFLELLPIERLAVSPILEYFLSLIRK